MYEKSKTMPHCVDVHRLLPIECLCVFLEGKLGDDTRLGIFISTVDFILFS